VRFSSHLITKTTSTLSTSRLHCSGLTNCRRNQIKSNQSINEIPTILRCGRCAELSWSWRGTCSVYNWRRCSWDSSPSCSRQTDKMPTATTCL